MINLETLKIGDWITGSRLCNNTWYESEENIYEVTILKKDRRVYGFQAKIIKLINREEYNGEKSITRTISGIEDKYNLIED